MDTYLEHEASFISSQYTFMHITYNDNETNETKKIPM